MDVSVWNSYSAMKKKRSYWLAGKMGYVTIGCFRHEGFYSVNFGKRNYCEKFLMDVSVLNSYSAMKKKLSYWLAGKMRGVPIGWRRRDGFYSVNVGADKKIIAINSNMCLTYNFYLFLQWEVKLTCTLFLKSPPKVVFASHIYKKSWGGGGGKGGTQVKLHRDNLRFFHFLDFIVQILTGELILTFLFFSLCVSQVVVTKGSTFYVVPF